MNHIFHYYITAFLAQKAGFSQSDAMTLAFASQYVDNALVPLRVAGAGTVPYEVATTHHFGFWSREQEDLIWIPFHFFPSGESGALYRRDGIGNRWCVRARSSPSTELLVSALRTNNIYRIGIALHTFADTWAHQNFTGRRDEFNHIEGSLLIPPVGHAQLESTPDVLHMKWNDSRLIDPHITNRSRFLEAAHYVYLYLAKNRLKDTRDAGVVIAELEQLIGPELSKEQGKSPSGVITSQIRRKLNEVKMKARNLTDSFIDREHAENNETSCEIEPLLCGNSDKEIAVRFQNATGISPYDRRIWRQEAFVKDRNFLDDTLHNSSINDKISWIQHEIFSHTKITVAELQAQPNFFSSHLYNWSEAAFEHRREASLILKNL